MRICFVSCTIRNAFGLSHHLCQVNDNRKGLSFPTSRVGDIKGIGEPVTVLQYWNHQGL